MRGIITIDVEISVSYEDGPEKINAYINDLRSIIIEQQEIIAQ